MSHRLSACELGEHVDEDLRLPPPSAAVGSRLALPEAPVVPALGSLPDSARGAPAQPHDRCAGNSHDTRGGGDLSPPAAGPTDAEREPAPVKAPRPDRSTGMAA